MFGLRKRGPTRPFAHADDCRIVRADPGVEIPWSEVEAGHLQRTCTGGTEDFVEPVADRVRLDPPPGPIPVASSAVLRLVLRIEDGAAAGLLVGASGTCDTGWQVPHYAAESVK
jgi:hypothetical protein